MTLTEILVVVGIIALLAALAFPAFSLVREQARQAKCMNNLKQIGTIIQTYKQDFPDPGYPGELVGLVDAPALVCPSDRRRLDPAEPNLLNMPPTPDSAVWFPLHEVGSSYLYELRGILSPDPQNSAGRSCRDFKMAQLLGLPPFGSVGPVDPSRMPILRCYHHTTWTGDMNQQPVLNLFADLSVGWSASWWEKYPGVH